jgi:hypothetical protein
MLGVIIRSYKDASMSDINLNTAVNQHFLDSLIRLAGARRISATHDIIDVYGVLEPIPVGRRKPMATCA